jgi:hypothetical protein
MYIETYLAGLIITLVTIRLSKPMLKAFAKELDEYDTEKMLKTLAVILFICALVPYLNVFTGFIGIFTSIASMLIYNKFLGRVWNYLGKLIFRLLVGK